MKKINTNIVEELVKCRAIKPSAFISLDRCKDCQFHKDIEVVMPSADKTKTPDVKDVICALPGRVRIDNKIEVVKE